MASRALLEGYRSVHALDEPGREMMQRLNGNVVSIMKRPGDPHVDSAAFQTILADQGDDRRGLLFFAVPLRG